MRQSGDFSLFDTNGHRKYLTPEERSVFAEIAMIQDRETRTFCLLLNQTGIRISEGLNLVASNIDFTSKCVVVETLKKRKKGVYRQIPLSDGFLNELNLVHELRSKQRTKIGRNTKLWNWSRRTGSRRIDTVMEQAKIDGSQACPKGLRHGFAVWCIIQGVPLPTVQKWLGHSSMNTTAIYLQVTGKEERDFAEKIWV